MNLAENLQSLRKAAGLSQEELAEKCNVSRQAVAKWESGDSIPTLDKVICLADILSVSIDELVGRTEADVESKLFYLIKQYVVSDIPTNEEDDISAIVSRYLLFMKNLNIDPTDILNGLETIFLQ